VGALSILVPLVLIINIFPLIVSFSIDPNRSNYQPGHFQSLAADLVGPWIKVAFLIASQISLVGLCNSSMITAECTLAEVFEPFVAKHLLNSGYFLNCIRLCVLLILTFVFFPESPELIGKGEITWLLDNETTGTRRIYVLLVAVTVGILLWLPYDFLIELDILILILNMPVFLLAFVRLRIIQPNVPRPFRVPGNTIVAVLWCMPPLILTLVYGYIALIMTNRSLFGISHFNVVALLIVIIPGLLAWLVMNIPTKISDRFMRRDVDR
jgi:hypothetical protein